MFMLIGQKKFYTNLDRILLQYNEIINFSQEIDPEGSIQKKYQSSKEIL
jgi:hypothetical protein